MASSGEISPLARWRTRLWPIQTFELKKILPLLFMKFFISFTYGVLTNIKEAAVVTAKGSGVEVTSVLKGWVVLPVALGATILYSKLSNIFRRSVLFYGIITFFMFFIALYGFVLYPNMEALSPHKSADFLLEKLGSQNSHFVAAYRNWIPSLFFVVAELWGSIVIFLLFWGFVNHICNFGEAKRCYNLFVAGGDLAQMFTGPLVCFFLGRYVGDHFHLALKSLIGCVLFFGAMIMLLHYLLTRRVLKNDVRLFQPEDKTHTSDRKTKLTLIESLKFITKSPYLRFIAIMVISYGLTMNLTEVTWKANVKMVYPEMNTYQGFMANVSSWVGVCSFIITLLLGGVLIRATSWQFAAGLPPIVIGITSLTFLILFLNPEWISPLTNNPLGFIILFGAIQNVSTKVMKYAFFDPTKEMAFIPLDIESKVKGKAAIDVIGSRLGKSGAAWIQLILMQLVGTNSVLSITHTLIPIVACTVLFWIFSVRSLNKQLANNSIIIS